MRVLGLDLSLTATGLALVGVDAHPAQVAGRLFTPARGVTGAARLAWISDQIMGLAELIEPDLVAIEGYSYASTSLAHTIGELGGVVRYRLHVAGLSFVQVPPGEWRKRLFGRGNLPKHEVPKEAFKRYGVEFASLDVLEAWCVATAAWRRAQGLDRPEPKKRGRRVA